MAKKNAPIEEPAVEEAVNGLKEMNAEEQAAPVEETSTEEVPAEEVPAVEIENPNQVGLRTRAYRA